MEKRQKEAERKARAEAETLARVEEEKEKNAQVQDGFSHLDLCRQYCAEMRSIPGVPIGCERMLHIDEIRNIAKNCKCAKELNLKFGEEVDRKELETFLRDKKLVQRELVLAFADHGKQGAVLIATSYDEEKLREVNSWLSAADRRNNNHNIIYCSAEGEVKMFTLDEAGVSIHGAYMEQDQLVVWDYLFKPISFQPGTLGPALAELLQKLAIAFRGEKDYKQIQELELERREHKYQEYLVRKAKEQARGNVVLTVRKLAELGNVDAMYFLAVGSYNDQCLTNNLYESIELCEKAAIAGSVEAMVYMGLCCVTHFNGCKGNGVDAINWFSKAASNGSAEALRFLAICRYNGIGGDNLGPSSNRYWALDLLSEAIRQGDEEAKRIEKAVMKSQIINISKSEIWDRRNASIDKFKIGKIV